MVRKDDMHVDSKRDFIEIMHSTSNNNNSLIINSSTKKNNKYKHNKNEPSNHQSQH